MLADFMSSFCACKGAGVFLDVFGRVVKRVATLPVFRIPIYLVIGCDRALALSATIAVQVFFMRCHVPPRAFQLRGLNTYNTDLIRKFV